MSADLLREAAALMRERAEATIVTNIDGDTLPWHSLASLELEWDAEDAGHIAGMSPAVALAVADWLDTEASRHEFGLERPGYDVAECCRMPQALAVARAYLGRES